MSAFSLYDAKTHLSSLVERAAAGEEIVITKHGVALAKLVSAVPSHEPRRPAGTLKVEWIAPDFDAVDPEIVTLFDGHD